MQQTPPYYFLAVPFDSKNVAHQFIAVVIAMLIVPMSVFYGLRNILQSTYDESASSIAGIAAVLSVQLVIGAYVYVIIKDPTNFKQQPQQSKQPQPKQNKVKQQ